jgi:hypothetical protein
MAVASKYYYKFWYRRFIVSANRCLYSLSVLKQLLEHYTFYLMMAKNDGNM